MMTKQLFESLYKQQFFNESSIKDSIMLFESKQNDIHDNYDIFLSYSSNDKEYAKFTYSLLKKERYKIYVDYNDEILDPSNVSKKTAEELKNSLSRSKMILYLHSQNSKLSRWCQWELGVATGLNKLGAYFPIVTDISTYKQEYLQLYPYIDFDEPEGGTKKIFWVMESQNKYTTLKKYLQGYPLREH